MTPDTAATAIGEAVSGQASVATPEAAVEEAQEDEAALEVRRARSEGALARGSRAPRGPAGCPASCHVTLHDVA